MWGGSKAEHNGGEAHVGWKKRAGCCQKCIMLPMKFAFQEYDKVAYYNGEGPVTQNVSGI